MTETKEGYNGNQLTGRDTGDFTTIRSLLGALARVMNLINPEMEHHHEQTAYLSYMIARRMFLPNPPESYEDQEFVRVQTEKLHLAIYAALLHDVGSILEDGKTTIEEFEGDARKVAKSGASILRGLPEFERIADLIEFCPFDWNDNMEYLKCSEIDHTETAEISSIVHLSDKVATMLNPDRPVLNQVEEICERVKGCKGFSFCDRSVEALLSLSDMEFMWLDAMLNPEFLNRFIGDMHHISLEHTASITRLISRIIDYRSPFTAMHSAGVSASAKKLAELAGMSREDCLKMEIAGNLHDTGKLRVPREILEKPGKLTTAEFNIMREHPYYTRLILMDVDGFEDIANWAGLHHEKLKGNGYPFHFNGATLDEGSKIMAVADIFSAITEERPYRKGMTRDQAMDILSGDAKNGAISSELVTLLSDHYAEVDELRDQESRVAGKRYFDSMRMRNEAEQAG